MKRNLLLIPLVMSLAGCALYQEVWSSGDEQQARDSEEAVEISAAPDAEESAVEEAEQEVTAAAEPREAAEQEPATQERQPEEDEAVTQDEPEPAEQAEAATEPEPQPEPEPAQEQTMAAQQQEPEEPAAETAQTESAANAGGGSTGAPIIMAELDSHPGLSPADHPPLTAEEYSLLQEEVERRGRAGEDTEKYLREIEQGRSEGGVMAWFYRHWLQ